MNILLIGVGGALGAISRYALTDAVTKYFSTSQYIGTLSVNILGCFLVGLLFGLFADMKSDHFICFAFLFLQTRSLPCIFSKLDNIRLIIMAIPFCSYPNYYTFVSSYITYKKTR